MPAFQALREAGHLPLIDVSTGSAELRGACSFLVNATTGERAADPNCLGRMMLPCKEPRPSSMHGVERRGPAPLLIRVNGLKCTRAITLCAASVTLLRRSTVPIMHQRFALHCRAPVFPNFLARGARRSDQSHQVGGGLQCNQVRW